MSNDYGDINVRQHVNPKINFDATELTDLISWDKCYEPVFTCNMDKKEKLGGLEMLQWLFHIFLFIHKALKELYKLLVKLQRWLLVKKSVTDMLDKRFVVGIVFLLSKTKKPSCLVNNNV